MWYIKKHQLSLVNFLCTLVGDETIHGIIRVLLKLDIRRATFSTIALALKNGSIYLAKAISNIQFHHLRIPQPAIRLSKIIAA
jgi:hypothetical protein